jgi:hypothetical protein
MKKLFRMVILTDDFRQDPDVDPLTPESVAGWLVMGSVFGDGAFEWEIFEHYQDAQERAWELMGLFGETAKAWNVYPLYAGEPIRVEKLKGEEKLAVASDE